MDKEYLPKNKVKLTAPNGVVDTRNGQWYSEAIVKVASIRYFKAA